MFAMLQSSSPVIRGILVLLLFFSLVSWTIFIVKVLRFRKAAAASKRFLDYVWKTKTFDETAEGLGAYADSPLAAVCAEGIAETERAINAEGKNGEARLYGDLNPLESVARTLRNVSGAEADKLEQSLGFLATTASATPFIGLFGTVWGIMNAFENIGRSGSTSLAIVAPGISEALVTTAIGLAVAIPAVIAYNFLQSRVKRQAAQIDAFASDFLNLAQRLIQAKRREA